MFGFFKKPNGTGLVHDPEIHSDPRNLDYSQMTFGVSEVPESGSVVDKLTFPLNQWQSNACTAHAAAQVFHILGNKKLSPRQAYWRVKTDPSYPSHKVSYGAYLKDPFVAFIKGIADYDVAPNPTKSITDQEYLQFSESPETLNSAIKNEMGGVYVYPTLANGSTAIFDATVRYMHEQMRPVVLGIEWHSEYNKARVGGIIPAKYADSSVGGHAICAVAWKTIDGEPYIGCINSWGESWGDGGLVWIPRNFSIIFTAISWVPPEEKFELKIKTETQPIKKEDRDESKERSNAQELQNFVDTTFPPVGDVTLNTQNTLARSIFAKEKYTFIRAVCYLGWTFQDVMNHLNARSRGKTKTKAYKLDFTQYRNVK